MDKLSAGEVEERSADQTGKNSISREIGREDVSGDDEAYAVVNLHSLPAFSH